MNKENDIDSVIIESKVLCMQNKHMQAVDILVKNNLIAESLDILVMLEKYEQSIKILK